MSEKIKSALEKALERAEAMPEVSPDSIASIENVPQGRGIAAAYLNEEEFDLVRAVSEIPGDVKRFVLEGIQEVLLANIVLPGNEYMLENSHKAMEGVMAIKEDKPSAGGLLSEIDSLLQYYQQSITQTMEKFKKEYEIRNQNQNNTRERSAGMQEFQEEWAKVVRQIDQQFEVRLADFKQQIKQIH